MSTKSDSKDCIGLVYPYSVRIFVSLTKQFMSKPIPPGLITPVSASKAATPPMGKPSRAK